MHDNKQISITLTGLKNLQSYIGDAKIDTPEPDYVKMLPHWQRMRAIIGGDVTVKQYDHYIRQYSGNSGYLYGPEYTTILNTFGPEMKREQYDWYQTESNFPGYTLQHLKTMIGQILESKPSLQLPDNIDESVLDWIQNEFTADNKSLYQYIAELLYEELTTGRCFVWIDYDEEQSKPVPFMLKAEDVLNVKYDGNKLKHVIIQVLESIPNVGKRYHANYVKKLYVHELDPDDNNLYNLKIYEKQDSDDRNSASSSSSAGNNDYYNGYVLREEIKPVMNNNRLDFIPIYQMQGHDSIVNPPLQNFAKKEELIYNYQSRKTHLLYGAALYTPVLKTKLSERIAAGKDGKQKVYQPGQAEENLRRGKLGGILVINQEDDLNILAGPSEAVADFDKGINDLHHELAKMGVRFLQEDRSRESGIAMRTRKHETGVILSSMTGRVIASCKKFITLMVNWREDLDLDENDISLTFSTDLTSQINIDNTEDARYMLENRLLSREAFFNTAVKLNIVSSDLTYEGEKDKIEAEMKDQEAMAAVDQAISERMLNIDDDDNDDNDEGNEGDDANR